ncbi:MAG: flagellar export protein FliJ [Spirochaetales bacterium]|jgi:flagellar protein FliJ|nr:flagellar export protein FliJ [Spirochaetales bacterium]
MKSFKFKLERILSLRKYREREWEIRLAGVTGECVKLRREIEDRGMRKAKAFLDSHEKSTGEIDSVELLNSYRYMSRLDQESEKKGLELAEWEIKREEVQASYLDASRQRKVLDKLKEKRSFSYLKEQKTEEIKEIDDINTGRAARTGKPPRPVTIPPQPVIIPPQPVMTESDNG